MTSKIMITTDKNGSKYSITVNGMTIDQLYALLDGVGTARVENIFPFEARMAIYDVRSALNKATKGLDLPKSIYE